MLLVSNDRESFRARMPLVNAARKAGYYVEAVLPPGAGIPGLVTHDWHLDRRSLDPLQAWRSTRDLTALYRRLRPDLVHHFTLKAIAFGGVAARRAGIPAVHTVTGLGYVFIGDGLRRGVVRVGVEVLLRRALREAQAVMFQNEDDLALFVRRHLVRPESTHLVRGSGIDLRRFHPLAEPEGPLVASFIGRFLVDKGVRDFVAAARLLQGTDLRLTLVGAPDPGNPANVSDKELESWSMDGLVDVRPWTSDIPAELARSHIICLPSYREGVPRVLLEAAASGRPIVATDVPGNREVVRHGVTGLLVPPRDPAALAAALRRLASDASLRATMGRAARILVEEHFAQEVVHQETMACYAKALRAQYAK